MVIYVSLNSDDVTLTYALLIVFRPFNLAMQIQGGTSFNKNIRF